jgi:class 3 adenylate cyclase
MTNASGPVVDRAAGRAERRSLTVLFADVVGSSALAARLDPEDLRDILHRVQATFREAIGRYDGHLARYLGDGALACFGFPVAHEDDAERAVNAALEMIEAVSALPSPEGPALQLHIGIATGLVVVGDRAGEGGTQDVELVGGPVNLAASLQVHAAPGEILISPRTRRLVGALFDVADLGERSVKGHEQPVRVWSVLRRSAVQARFDARQSAGLTPFVGRDRELARLEDAYERAKAGEARLVTVSGDPGIGKSRLILALRERLAAEAPRTFFFQCSSRHTSSPWHPVIRHLEDAAGIERAGAPALKLARLEGFVARWLPDRRDEVLPLMAALLSIPTAEHDPAAALTPQQR